MEKLGRALPAKYYGVAQRIYVGSVANQLPQAQAHSLSHSHSHLNFPPVPASLFVIQHPQQTLNSPRLLPNSPLHKVLTLRTPAIRINTRSARRTWCDPA